MVYHGVYGCFSRKPTLHHMVAYTDKTRDTSADRSSYYVRSSFQETLLQKRTLWAYRRREFYPFISANATTVKTFWISRWGDWALF